ncbi:hypothetical protein O181_005456 [Austropuccinia psidii MF-1]|uniref:Uncharacterized protein n=1 Tax=Austropuccinia psidii MF-1 TaxID=1389203 RepID=A0A9Q3BIW3_9BASI|nr:hypothetical protein [Austropuccinia psidii MF-1]
MQDRGVVISRHVRFDETCFPAITRSLTTNTAKEQHLNPLLNLPTYNTNLNKTSNDKDDICSEWEEQFHDDIVEQHSRRIRVLAPRHFTLISGDVSGEIYYLTEEENTKPLRQQYQITTNRPSMAKN